MKMAILAEVSALEPVTWRRMTGSSLCTRQWSNYMVINSVEPT